MSCCCGCPVALPRGAMGWSAVFLIVVFPDLLMCVAPILAATDATYLGIRHSTDFRVLSGERQQQ